MDKAILKNVATRIIAIRNRKIEKDIVFPFLMTMVE